MLFAHNFGDGVKNLVVTASAACGTMSELLNLLEVLFNVAERAEFFQCVLNVEIGYLLTFADCIVYHFHHLPVY